MLDDEDRSGEGQFLGGFLEAALIAVIAALVGAAVGFDLASKWILVLAGAMGGLLAVVAVLRRWSRRRATKERM